MTDDVLSKINGLEIRFDERWDAHDKNSKIRWDEIKRQLEDIKLNLKCFATKEELTPINYKINGIIGTAAIVGAILLTWLVNYLGG